MTMIRTVGLLAGATTLSISGMAGATDIDNASIEALRTELSELRSQNESLEARLDAQDDAWLNEARATEIRGIVQDVLTDSQTRTSLQDSNAMAGYKAGSGFYLSSQDGSFSMHISGQIQARWVMNHVSDGTEAPGPNAPGVGNTNNNQTKWGFQVRRAKVKFGGNVFDKTWTYQVNGAFGPQGTAADIAGINAQDGMFVFQEAMITKAVNDNLSITFGQFKAPWTREELVSSSEQLAVERSLVNEYFNADRAVGVDVMYKTDAWSFEAAYNNGVTTAINPNVNNYRYTAWNNNPTKWAFQGRFQYKLSGDWSDFESFTSSPGDEQAIMIGVGGMGQEYNGQIAMSNSDSMRVWGITADVSAKFGGLSAFASMTWQNFEDSSGNKVNPWGFVGQAGYSLNDEWEIFGRFEWANSGGAQYNTFSAQEAQQKSKLALLTVGANYFINSNVKFTADWGINFNNNLDGMWVNEAATGWRTTQKSSEWVLRAQLQLLF